MWSRLILLHFAGYHWASRYHPDKSTNPVRHSEFRAGSRLHQVCHFVLQLKLFVTVTTYCVEISGWTMMVESINPPGIHTYVPPPIAVIVSLCPKHNVLSSCDQNYRCRWSIQHNIRGVIFHGGPETTIVVWCNLCPANLGMYWGRIMESLNTPVPDEYQWIVPIFTLPEIWNAPPDKCPLIRLSELPADEYSPPRMLVVSPGTTKGNWSRLLQQSG